MSTYNGGLPAISVGSFSQIGATSSIPRNRVDSNWHFVDNYSWKTGKHDVKFGYEFRRTTIMQVIDHNFRGTLSFDGLTNFLQGLPDWRRIQVQGDSERHTFQNSDGLFIQDSFRATPELTLNYGLRWDYFGVTGEKNGLFYTVDPANGGSNVPTGQLYGKDLNNFAPRVAFAYDVTGKGQDRHPRRMGIVLRRVLARHVPRPPAVELHLLPRTGLSRSGAASAGYGSVDRYAPPCPHLTPGGPSIRATVPRAISSPSIRTCARLTCRTST